MYIQPVSNLYSFTGVKTTENGNEYHSCNSGRVGGFILGSTLTGTIIANQLLPLKTIAGKRNLLESLHERGKQLNDIMPRTIERNEEGEIVPPLGGVSARSKKVVGKMVRSLSLLGLGIIAVTTGVGYVLDKNTELARSRMADGYIKPANYY